MATITGTSGNNSIDEIAGGGDINENDEIFALAGDDVITMYENFDDTPTGSPAFYDDITDIVHGGAGTDTLRLTLTKAYTFNVSGNAGFFRESLAHSGGNTSLWTLNFDSVERFDLTLSVAGAITLGNGNDLVTATVGGTNVNTGGGNDTATYRVGTNTVDLGSGSDRLVLDQLNAASAVSMTVGLSGSLGAGYSGQYYISGGSAQTSFSGVENFTITSGASSDAIVTGDGDDVISTNNGNDTIVAGAGANVIDGGANTDTLGIDLSSQSQGVTIDLLAVGAQQTGGVGSVTNIESFGGTVTGTAFGDTLIEGVYSYNATFNTGGGDDLVQVSLGTDTVNLEAGNDRLVLAQSGAASSVVVTTALTGSLATGYSGEYYVNGGSSRTTFSGAENFTITSGASSDAIVTGDGDDVISTNNGNDTIVAGAGANVIDGGANTDTLGIDLSSQSQGVTIDLLAVGAQQTGGVGSVTNIESFGGTVTGTAFGDTLIEGIYSYNATFNTGGGDDLVQVSLGTDTVNLQAGNDRLVLAQSGAASSVYMTVGLSGSLAAGYSGQYYISGASAQTTFSGVENFTITSGASDDTIVTGDGDDVISTNIGNDAITAGAGTNVIDGGAGSDRLGIDLSSQSQGVTIDLTATGAQQTGGVGSVTNIESFGGTVTGTAFGDTLIEGIYSYNATFNTGGGDDLVQVSLGTDTVDLGIGNDRLVLAQAAAASTVYMTVGLSGSLATGYSGEYYISGASAQTTFSGVENFTITSGASDDTIVTGDGDDVISTNNGNDVIAAGAGANVVDGGVGIDRLGIDLSSQSQGVTIDLTATGAQQTGGVGSVTNIESFGGTVTGTAFGDTLIEGIYSYNATFNTGGGDDLVQVSLGTDTVDLGTGNDRLVLAQAAAASTVYMTTALSGSLATGYSGQYYISGASSQTTFSGVENFTIISGNSNDIITTGDGADTIDSGIGNDRITVGAGADVVDGGMGIDALSISLSDETQGVTIDLTASGVQQSGGSGSITNIESFIGAVTGSRFADTLIETAVAFDATFDTGAGNDLVQVSLGSDVVNMGTGKDRLVLAQANAASTVYMTVGLSGSFAAGYSGQYYISGGSAQTTFSGVEHFTITSGASNDTIFTGDGEDVIDTGGGNDTVTAGGGNDLVIGGAGNDTLNGGAGKDTAGYATAATGVTVTLASGAAQITGDGTDTLSGFENLTGSAFADQLTGDGGVNVLDGGDGNDRLFGGGGVDRLYGGGGDDSYVIDVLGDRVLEFAGGGFDTVEAAVTYRLTSEVEALLLTGTGATGGTGNALDNVITGNDSANRLDGRDGDDVLNGGGGADTLIGGAGVDTMSGGAGDDRYVVDDAGDIIIELSGGGNDEVQTFVDYVLSAEVEKLTLSGAARIGTGNALDNLILGTNGTDTLYGMDGADTLRGNDGADTLYGGIGDDVLEGGANRDILNGGIGADRFLFRAGDTAATLGPADQIDDFSHAQGDRIALNAIDANTTTLADDAFSFIGTAAFSNTAGELRYQTIGADTFVQGDTDGNGAADFMIRLTGALTLVAGDFAL